MVQAHALPVKLVDSSGKPVRGASLRSLDAVESSGARSDAEGRVDSPEGRIRVEAGGFLPWEGEATGRIVLVRESRVREQYRGLWQAAYQVATPHLRNMGTLGGNICLDTRCTYYDQNEEWRRSISFCMKKDGETCWVPTRRWREGKTPRWSWGSP